MAVGFDGHDILSLAVSNAVAALAAGHRSMRRRPSWAEGPATCTARLASIGGGAAGAR